MICDRQLPESVSIITDDDDPEKPVSVFDEQQIGKYSYQ